MTGLLTIKLGAAINMPTRHMLWMLDRCSSDCCLASNAAVRHWVRRCEDLGREPESNEWWDGKGAYHAATQAAVSLNTKIVSSAVKRVKECLGSRCAWQRSVTAKYRWQAVLRCEDAQPFWRRGVILVPCQDARIGYLGRLNADGPKKIPLEPIADDHAVLYVPMLSNRSNQRVKHLLCKLEVRQLKGGHKRILRNITDPEQQDWKLGDSQLVYDNGKWLLRMTYRCPDPVKVEGNVLTVLPAKSTDRNPLVMRFPHGGQWYFGDGNYYASEMQRTNSRQRVIQWKRDMKSNHGRGGVYAKTRPLTRRRQMAADRVLKKIVNDVVSAAIKHECGTVLYREPSLGLRKFDWYAARRLQFAWDDFSKRLDAKLKSHGIELKTERMMKAEWDGLSTAKTADNQVQT